MTGYVILTLSGSDPALEPYKAMIYSDWLNSLRYLNDWFNLIDQNAYFKTYHQVIEALLNRSNSQVRLAVLSDELDNCLGWSMSEDTTLHYLFVKRDFRRHGIGKSLLPAKVEFISHLTKTGKSLWQAKLPEAHFNPFL